jgi:hypothetical protein
MENNLSGDRVVTLLTLTHQQSVFGFGRSRTKAIGLDWHPGAYGEADGAEYRYKRLPDASDFSGL